MKAGARFEGSGRSYKRRPAREPFDYTEWQRQLWPDISVEVLSQAATARRSQVSAKDTAQSEEANKE